MRERNTEAILKDSNALLILGLGDSFTEGIGTPQDSTWLRLLEDKLIDSGKPVIALNGGLGGSDPIQEYIKYTKVFHEFDPDLVILSINRSDINDVAIRGPSPRIKDGQLTYMSGPSWEYFYGASYFIRGFVRGILKYNWMLMTEEEWTSLQEESESQILACVHQFRSLAKQHNFKFLVILSPVHHEFESSQFELANLSRKLQEIEDLWVLDLYEAYLNTGTLKRDNVMNYYWEMDFHHNSKGYNLWAEVLKSFIIKNKIL